MPQHCKLRWQCPPLFPTPTLGAAVEKTAEQTNVQKNCPSTTAPPSPSVPLPAVGRLSRLNPEAKSGAYWLYTPVMSAPTQFLPRIRRTDGGGWVKIKLRAATAGPKATRGQGDLAQAV